MKHSEWTETRGKNGLIRLLPWLVLSVLVHLFLLPVLFDLLPEEDKPMKLDPLTLKSISSDQWMQNRSIKQQAKSQKVASKTKIKKKPEPKKEKKLKKPDGQLVDIAMPKEEKKPDKAKYVSQYNSSVEKETKAKIRKPSDKVAAKPSAKKIKFNKKKAGEQEDRLVLDRPSKAQPNKVASDIQKSLRLIPKLKMKVDLDLKSDAKRGRFKNREGQKTPVNGNADRLAVMLKKERQAIQSSKGASRLSNIPKSLLPSFSESVDTSGNPMTDFLPDVDKGEGTYLNTRAFKYATYYNRIKRLVASRWSPAQAQMRFDPTYAIYGYQNRYTVLYIVLDKDGNLEKANVKRSCGVGFLDQEAISAMIGSGPFPNPPAGILEEDGTIKFPFGFYFEMSRMGRRINGQ